MPGRKIDIPGVGPATMYKRRGMRNIRISVSPAGTVRINLPKWSPYLTAERFAVKNKHWILKQLASRSQKLISDGDIIGHGAVVIFERSAGIRTTTKVSAASVLIRSPLDPASSEFQTKARTASERALRLQANVYLPQRTNQLAKKNGLEYKQLVIKRLTSRWGSCSPSKNISLSFFLMQLPDELLDYVILHELAHTSHMNHGPKFWQRLEQALPGAKNIRKQMRGYTPHLSDKGRFDSIDKEDLHL